MEQAVLTRQEFNECTVRHNGAYLAFVDFAYFGDSYNPFDDTHSIINALLVGTGDFDSTDVVHFFNSNGSTGFFLHTLDNLSTRADDSTDEFLGNGHCLDTRSVRFQVFARLGNALGDFAQDIFTAFFSLQQCLFEDFV